MRNWRESLFILGQYLVPQHAVSRLVGKLAHCRWRWFKNGFIKWFIQRYQVNMAEALEPNPENYPDFNSFFVRALRPEARSFITDPQQLMCPVDGCVSQIGTLDQELLLQAKDRSYSLTALLGGNAECAALFNNGSFATLYLAPRDYHRIHMPLAGKLMKMWHVPGQLFSVNPVTAERVENLFARNERVVCLFETAVGPMAVILVGAMIVASVETVWAGTIATPLIRAVQHWDYQTQAIELARGAELGRFKLGSTVIVLFGAQRMQWLERLQAGSSVRLGQSLGYLL